jgi:hypothetical protein
MSFRTTLVDDEYAAKLLADDAKKSSLRYAQQGLSALLPRRPTGKAPKPNTRFLKAIVREADSHNFALRKKEALEASRRQRDAKCDRGYTVHTSYEDERPRKRRRFREEGNHQEERQGRKELSQGRLSADSEQSTSRERRHNKARRAHDDGALHGVSRDVDRQGHTRYRSRSRSADRQDEMQTAHKQQRSKKDCKRRRRRSRSVQSGHSVDEQRLEKSGQGHPATRRSTRQEGDEAEIIRQSSRDAYESDPLEMLVGPLKRPGEKGLCIEGPPIRSKGRGAYRSAGAAMDAHFSADYNPGLDLHPDSELDDEKEDWDMALEALRDRQMFKQKQAERLREAGFDDIEITKWEDSGKEKDVTGVKWTTRGEPREWDLGKEDHDGI